MRKHDIVRALLFVVFFSIGAAALAGAVLCDDLVRYYHDRELLKSARESTERLRSLIADYDALLGQLENDPNLFDRVGVVALGKEPPDANAVYPPVTPEQLAAARKALAEVDIESAEPTIPYWLTRSSEPSRRIVLFLAGAFLVLLSFMFFARSREVRIDTETVR